MNGLCRRAHGRFGAESACARSIFILLSFAYHLPIQAESGDCVHGENCRNQIFGKCDKLHYGDTQYTPVLLMECKDGSACGRIRRQCSFCHEGVID